MAEHDGVLDRAHLERATGGDTALMEELLGMLRRELPARQSQLARALADDDPAGAAEAAHKLQGAARYTGARALDRAAARFETAARAGDRDGLTEARHELDDAIEALIQVLAGNGHASD